jgi:hypothetical protein
MLRYNFNNASALCARQHGASYGLSRYLFSRTELRNMTAGQGIPDQKIGIPNGHLDPSSWILPISPGSISAYEDLNITFDTSLVRSTTALMNGSITISSTLSASMNGIGYISGSITPFTELSPKNLADAVWNASSSNYTLNETMGKQVNNTKRNADLIPALV